MGFKKIYIFHTVTSLILLVSVGIIYTVLTSEGDTSSEEWVVPETMDYIEIADEASVATGAVPFTREEFERAEQEKNSAQNTGYNRSRHNEFSSLFSKFHRIDLPLFMKGQYYTPGLPVSLYATTDLDPETEETFPGEGAFYLTDHIRKDDTWVYQVKVRKRGRDTTMYLEEDALTYANFYGPPPPDELISAYEVERMKIINARETREADRQAAYELALHAYRTAEAEANAGFDLTEISALAYSDSRKIMIFAIVGIASIFFGIAVFFGINWVRKNRSWEGEYTIDELTDTEHDSPSEEYTVYSPFFEGKKSERGSDYYDSKEDDLADHRF